MIPLWCSNVSAGAATGVRNVSFNCMGVPEYQKTTK